MGLNQFDADLRSEGYLTLDEDLDNIENAYIKNKGEFLVGFYKKELVAIGALRNQSAARAEIKRMGVQPEYQRRGFGQLILEKLIDTALRLGYTELYLDTTAQNIPAQKLYEKHGFIQTHHKKIGRLEIIFYEQRLISL